MRTRARHDVLMLTVSSTYDWLPSDPINNKSNYIHPEDVITGMRNSLFTCTLRFHQDGLCSWTINNFTFAMQRSQHSSYNNKLKQISCISSLIIGIACSKYRQVEWLFRSQICQGNPTSLGISQTKNEKPYKKGPATRHSMQTPV